MKAFFLPIRTKIPVAMIGLSALVAVVLVALAYTTVRTAALGDAAATLTRLSQDRAAAVTDWVSRQSASTLALAANPTIAKSTSQLESSLLELGEAPLDELRRLYVTENPFPAAERFKLEEADAKGGYHFRHAALHSYIGSLLEESRSYDAFLISPSGDILYTYAKEADFATNLVSGPFADSGLALAFREALKAETGRVVLSDFSRYAPSGNAGAMFAATPIEDAFGTRVGVVALQLPADDLSGLLNAGSEALGESLQSYLVGPDGLARSALRLGNTKALMPLGAPLPPEAVAGQPLPTDHLLQTGNPGMALATSVDLGGHPWTLVTERDMADILSPVRAFLIKVAGLGLLLLCLVAGVGLAVVRSITIPIARVKAAIAAI